MRNYVCESVAECRKVIDNEILQGGNHTVVVLLPKKVNDLADSLNESSLSGWSVSHIITPEFDATKMLDGRKYYAHSVSITCPFSGEEVRRYRKKLKSVSKPIKALDSDRKKVDAIARFICDSVEYKLMSCPMFAYSALMDGKAVCAGYSRLFRSICAECGINARCIDGTYKNQSHEWNEVFLDGHWEKIDVTFMDAKNRSHSLWGLT